MSQFLENMDKIPMSKYIYETFMKFYNKNKFKIISFDIISSNICC